MTEPPKLLKFPAPDKTGVVEALDAARAQGLTNVLILSQKDDGSIYHVSNDDMTLAESNWLVTSYLIWLHTVAAAKD